MQVGRWRAGDGDTEGIMQRTKRQGTIRPPRHDKAYDAANDVPLDDADDRTLPLGDTSEAHRTAQVHRHVCLDLVVGIAAVSAYGKVDKTKVHVLKVLRAAGERAVARLPHVPVEVILEGSFAHEACGIPQRDW